MARISRKRSLEDESALFENYMRVMAKAFARRLSRELANRAVSNATVDSIAVADVDLIMPPKIVKPRRKKGSSRG